MSGWTHPCGDMGVPHGLLYPRRYPIGWRCDRHSPNGRRGLPEPPGPLPGSYLAPDRTTDPDPPAEQEPS
ncbi:hypothetical protein IFE09_11150 [Streptomyces microflavus]|uniref:hypothetical protein n=1 Tax=Streptomyces microflavus TaxID=1919 RepID=UPI00192B0CBB|nr:hypothetical protein [Streptomyces microflavus]QQZ54114.1 hypothetical protein IFE09_11150 [Streptomyces microflavus]WSS36674.1 hypothetical protein OG269_25955 [Streptomyces microflavus]